MYVRIIFPMATHRQVTKIGGSLGVLVPRDMAEAMGITQAGGDTLFSAMDTTTIQTLLKGLDA
jgi:hypothetical protein